MSVTASVNKSVQLGGKQFQKQQTLTGGLSIVREASVPAALSGNLSTRTDNDTGVVTITGTNTIATGNRVDVYWSGGSRRGMVVGTVAGQTVPIDLGAGDNLPSAATAVKVAVAQESVFQVAGDNVIVLAMYTTSRGTIVLADASNVELMSKVLAAGGVYIWDNTDGSTNELAGDTVAKVFMSHEDITAKTMRVGAMI